MPLFSSMAVSRPDDTGLTASKSGGELTVRLWVGSGAAALNLDEGMPGASGSGFERGLKDMALSGCLGGPKDIVLSSCLGGPKDMALSGRRVAPGPGPKDMALPVRLGMSSIQMSVGSPHSSSSLSFPEARKRLEDVMVSDLSMVILPRLPGASSSSVVGRLAVLLLRPRQEEQQPPPPPPPRRRGRTFSHRAATLRRDDAVVPKTMYRKMPGVVPGMKRKSVCMARPLLRSGAEALASRMLFCSAVI